jgi:uncharacterized protein (TIGR03000 family)
MQFIPAAPIPQNTASNQVFFPVAMPWGWGVGIGYRTFNPWVGYSYAFGGILPPGGFGPQAIVVEPPVAPEPPQAPVVLSEEFPATLSVQIPASGSFWLNDKKLEGKPGASTTLTSPVLQMGQKYTFYVKARWERDGKTYEAKRAVTLGAGENSRLMILSGSEVRD